MTGKLTPREVDHEESAARQTGSARAPELAQPEHHHQHQHHDKSKTPPTPLLRSLATTTASQATRAARTPIKTKV